MGFCWNKMKWREASHRFWDDLVCGINFGHTSFTASFLEMFTCASAFWTGKQHCCCSASRSSGVQLGPPAGEPFSPPAAGAHSPAAARCTATAHNDAQQQIRVDSQNEWSPRTQTFPLTLFL